MANIFDYLDWRGDILFSQDPFNEVDNLVLAELAYTDFDGIIGEDPLQGLSVRELNERYFSLHTEEEIRGRNTISKLAPLLLPKMAGGARFADVKVMGYVNRIDEEDNIQISAVTYALPDGVLYVAFRGTDSTLVGWKEDLSFGYMMETAGQKYAVDYINRHFSDDRHLLRVGGHSKGGNFAVYGASFCDESIQERIIEVYSNDGPGFQEAVTLQPGYEKILPRVISFIPEESLFGVLMYNRFENRVIKSSEKGILQHGALTWEVMRNHFIKAETTTDTSQLLDKTLTSWIESLGEAQRKDFIDTLYSVMSSAGVDTLVDLKKDPVGSSARMIKVLRAMEPEKQSMLSDTLLALMKSGKNAIGSELFESATGRTAEVILSLKRKWKELTSPQGGTPVRDKQEEIGMQPQKLLETDAEEE